MKFAAATLLILLAGCSGDEASPANGVLAAGPATNITAIDDDAITPELRALAEATAPGMTIDEAERKERDGRVYYDVEGKRADGSEVEIDVIDEGGTLRAVEVQRDIPWASVPPAVSTAAKAPFVPARVIESRQVDDGRIIYELFAPGKDDEPAMEVQVKDGRTTLLATRNPH